VVIAWRRRIEFESSVANDDVLAVFKTLESVRELTRS